MNVSTENRKKGDVATTFSQNFKYTVRIFPLFCVSLFFSHFAFLGKFLITEFRVISIRNGTILFCFTNLQLQWRNSIPLHPQCTTFTKARKKQKRQNEET